MLLYRQCHKVSPQTNDAPARLGLLCALAYLDRSAYRFGGVTLAIVLLIPRAAPAWIIAFHRFAEVSIGIAVALLFATVWPQEADVDLGKTNLLR